MFKSNWEKTSTTHSLPPGMVDKMLRVVYPEKILISQELMAGGCANLNVKILLEGEDSPKILRIYLRDKDSAYREQKIGVLLNKDLPVPQIYTIREVYGYHFAITEFMPGISLRDLLLSDKPYDIRAVMHDVGITLSKITKHTFSQAGFFDKELRVMPKPASEDYLSFAKECLEHENVLSVLTAEILTNISQTLGKYGSLFPDVSEKHLVHADFDPSNMLVNEVDGLWKVSGVLDWEFSFSGSLLWDVANMLRYAHKMPFDFQDAFLQGLTSGGVKLRENWHITVQLLNLLSLLDCLKRSDPKRSPNQCSDIFALVLHILENLNTTVEKKFS
jgi:Phosphotransferase enzyme family